MITRGKESRLALNGGVGELNKSDVVPTLYHLVDTLSLITQMRGSVATSASPLQDS